MLWTSGPMRAVLLLPLGLALVACDEPRRPSAAGPTVVPTAPEPTLTPTPPREPPELEPTV